MGTVVDKQLCYGCGVCVAFCPQDAIAMKKRSKAVLYALIDATKCNDCAIWADQVLTRRATGHIMVAKRPAVVVGRFIWEIPVEIADDFGKRVVSEKEVGRTVFFVDAGYDLVG